MSQASAKFNDLKDQMSQKPSKLSAKEQLIAMMNKHFYSTQAKHKGKNIKGDRKTRITRNSLKTVGKGKIMETRSLLHFPINKAKLATQKSEMDSCGTTTHFATKPATESFMNPSIAR